MMNISVNMLRLKMSTEEKELKKAMDEWELWKIKKGL